MAIVDPRRPPLDWPVEAGSVQSTANKKLKVGKVLTSFDQILYSSIMEWRKVHTHPQYEIAENGELRRIRRSFIGGYYYQKPFLSDRGYYSYVLCAAGSKPQRIAAALLVAEAFIGPRPRDMTINHKDGNKTNNHWSNLEYCSALDNVRHAYRIGLMPSTRRVISKDLAKEIKIALETGLSRREAQKTFHVSRNVIRNIANGLTGARSTSEYSQFLSTRIKASYVAGRTKLVGEQHPNSKLRDGERQTIYTLVQSGRSRRSLAKQFGVSHTVINQLVQKLHTQEEKNNAS